ncbi:MAG TPA: hypothetical protein VHD63_14895 [Ktedonobacteraceae bacterium]|nr:hypothetical protein [Ktedonobacteraceae bacterium]
MVCVQSSPDDNEVGAAGTLLAGFLSYQAQQRGKSGRAGALRRGVSAPFYPPSPFFSTVLTS